MVTVALVLIAVGGLGATFSGGLVAAFLLALLLNVATSVARMAFDSLVQRDAPDANKGEVFARLETRFQLAWVLAGLPPVAVAMPGWFGFMVITGMAGVALVGISGRVGRSRAPVRRARLGSATNRADRTTR